MWRSAGRGSAAGAAVRRLLGAERAGLRRRGPVPRAVDARAHAPRPRLVARRPDVACRPPGAPPRPLPTSDPLDRPPCACKPRSWLPAPGARLAPSPLLSLPPVQKLWKGFFTCPRTCTRTPGRRKDSWCTADFCIKFDSQAQEFKLRIKSFLIDPHELERGAFTSWKAFLNHDAGGFPGASGRRGGGQQRSGRARAPPPGRRCQGALPISSRRRRAAGRAVRHGACRG